MYPGTASIQREESLADGREQVQDILSATLHLSEFLFSSRKISCLTLTCFWMHDEHAVSGEPRPPLSNLPVLCMLRGLHKLMSLRDLSRTHDWRTKALTRHQLGQVCCAFD